MQYFKNDRSFLSNFYICRVDYNDRIYPSAENAFQAAKVSPDDTRMLDYLQVCTPREAKRIGRSVKLPKNWDKYKTAIMLDIVTAKFVHSTSLTTTLLSTGDEPLVEANTWHDNIWGYCTCAKCAKKEHHNKLGKILERVRHICRLRQRMED